MKQQIYEAIRENDDIQLRQDILFTMTSVGIVERKTTISDGRGSSISTWRTVKPLPGCWKVPCDISEYDNRTTEETYLLNQMTADIRFVLTVPAETDILEKDRFLCKGNTYEIKMVANPITLQPVITAYLAVIR